MNRRRPIISIVKAARYYWSGSRSGSLIFTALAFGLLAFSTFNPQTTDVVRTVTYDLTAPVLNMVSAPIHRASAFVQEVSGLTQLQAENERLKQENLKLTEWYQRAVTLETENTYLKDMLNLAPEPNARYVSARVLSDSSSSFVKTLLVTAGKAHGVNKNQAVLSTNGLVGRITETGQKTARVLLITDINSRVPVLLENSRQHAVLAGQNNEMPILTYLPANTPIENGTRIITSGYGGIFPMGLPVGRIVKDNSGIAKVQLFADFSHLTHVRIADIY